MNDDNLQCLGGLIGTSYLGIVNQNRNAFSKKLRILFEQKKIPNDGFTDIEIEILLKEFANMDANNFASFTGVGEREGRIFSELVKRRHFGFSHGIGRSGDVSSLQPKAAGSSAINRLVNALTLHLFHEMGMRSAKSAVIIPMATGMTLTLCMLNLRWQRPNAKYVIWSRIDQKSCFKSILTAGFIPLIVDPVLVGDELQTNINGIEECLTKYGAENILCIMTTTSCFAPRVPDNIMKVAKICYEFQVPHLINNAYGLFLKRCMNVIEEASKKFGKFGVYAVVQSTDKNLMVPVGGAIVASPDDEVITRLSQFYAGRASITPTMDVLITLLSLGLKGLRQIAANREDNFRYLKEQLDQLSSKFPVRLMNTPHNPVSLALVLKTNDSSVTNLGSQLFYRSVSGARVVLSATTDPTEKTIDGYKFIGFGSHSSTSFENYINAAAAIGQTVGEIERFMEQLQGLLLKVFSKKGDTVDAL